MEAFKAKLMNAINQLHELQLCNQNLIDTQTYTSQKNSWDQLNLIVGLTFV